MQVTIAYDGSDGAARAVAAAAQLFPGASAHLVIVPDPAPLVPPDALARVTSAIEAHARSLVDEGVQAATAGGLVADGVVAPPRAPAWEGLLEAAAGSDVLVCGSRGRGEFARAMLGSTSAALLHHASMALLVVPDGDAPQGPAVLAFDGSEVAGKAIAVAAPLLGTREAVVVHVWQSPYRHTLTGRALAGVSELGDIVEGMESSIAAAAAEVTDAGVGLARSAGLSARGETLDSGDGVWRAVTAAAATLDAALIVSGARGLGGARSALLGSASSGLAHNAGRPVLVVPA